MERREFVGAALALFTGLAMPEPVRQRIWVWPEASPWGAVPPGPDAYHAYGSIYWLNAQREINEIWSGVVESIGDRRPFFEVLPGGPVARSGGRIAD